jgi:hypothetical protein
MTNYDTYLKLLAAIQKALVEKNTAKIIPFPFKKAS